MYFPLFLYFRCSCNSVILLPFTLSFHTKSRTCLLILLEHFVVVAPDAGSWTRLARLETFIIFVIGGYKEYPTNEQIQIKTKSIHNQLIFVKYHLRSFSRSNALTTFLFVIKTNLSKKIKSVQHTNILLKELCRSDFLIAPGDT